MNTGFIAQYAVFSLTAYLIGSIPFSYWVPKLMAGTDVREHGSGNTGASNVARVCGFRYGITCLALDVGKGAAAVTLMVVVDQPPLLGAAAILGHISSPFLSFSGGKGVATSVGVLAAFSWIVGVIVAGVWILTLAVGRVAAVSSLLALASAPVLMWQFEILGARLWMSLAILALILFTHRGNIARLLAGEEDRIRS